MTIKDNFLRPRLSPRPTFNLSGKEGNALSIVGFVREFADQYPNKINNADDIIANMLEGDYDNLITVFKKHFSRYIDIHSTRLN